MKLHKDSITDRVTSGVHTAKRRLKVGGIGLLLTIPLCLSAASGQTSAKWNDPGASGTVATRTIQKIPAQNGFCLNLHNNLNKSGAVVNLWRCNGHQSQQWRMNSDGTIRHGAYPNMCLNLHFNANTDGAVINLWNCTGHPSMQWRVNDDKTIRTVSYPNKCLNLHNNAFSNGAIVNLWTCNGHESQKWMVSSR